jgi:hypothetical protein
MPEREKRVVEAPEGLRGAGKALWSEMFADVPEAWEFDRRDLELLAQAARIVDAIVELEAAVDRDGVMIAGAAGQTRLNLLEGGAVTPKAADRLWSRLPSYWRWQFAGRARRPGLFDEAWDATNVRRVRVVDPNG